MTLASPIKENEKRCSIVAHPASEGAYGFAVVLHRTSAELDEQTKLNEAKARIRH